MPPDLTTTDQEIAALLRAVADAMERTAAPSAAIEGEQLEQYLGDVVDITFSGSEEQRVALIARLLTLARTVNAEHDADLRDYAWLRRLERPLRRWERDRRLGTAHARPRPAELDARVAMFGAAIGPDAVIGAHTVALSVAELVAIHQLAGATSVEEGIAARASLAPLLEEAARLLRRDSPDFGVGVFEQPGATLAHVDQATWQIEQILQHQIGAEELPWLRTLWLEVAAAIVFAHDAYERRDDHAALWLSVLDLAAEKLSVGELAEDPTLFDEARTLTLVRSVALQLAALWLDEARDANELASVPMLEDRLVTAAAQSLIAAWVAHRRLASA
ncbi:hypothetical protein [Conexibacter sp. CPCC 206217]|uniref:hypothetical protein n=1 Tax=Conexibacter sp. CPCC 206217 TaxID=3064574 RepID=UPI00271C2738|nr:hypothetical protein [Conexibacter sp. CPCC 206217]MDO8209012.1 hypothetical protein [Conexibacter sp. CPCC 206217]